MPGTGIPQKRDRSAERIWIKAIVGKSRIKAALGPSNLD
jgi:hypothetical protein